MTEIEYELYHHGVKGMKWGKRNARRAAAKQAKEARNKEIDKALQKLNKQSTLNERVTYRKDLKRAAKYMVDKKMSDVEALDTARTRRAREAAAAGVAVWLGLNAIVAYEAHKG